MKIPPFKLERYFAQYEFSAPYLLSCSDCEPLTLKELLSYADKDSTDLYNNLWLGYTESQGHPVLREEIVKLYAKIAKENVVVLTPEEGIFIALNVILEPKDNVIVTYPGYQSLYEVATAIGCEVTRWIPNMDKGVFSLADLQSIYKESTKLLVINFPHNPTGYLPTIDEFREIINFAKLHNIYVLSDEMYRFLEYDPNDRLDSASDLYDKAISLFGVSKSFALAGLRIGWLTTQNTELFKKICEFKDYTTICSSAPSEVLSIIALRNKEKIFSRNLKIINNNLALLDNFFEKYQSIFKWQKPRAGTIAFPELINGKKAFDLAQDLIVKERVMLLPSDEFDWPGQNMRFGFGRKNLDKSLEKFDKYLQTSF